MKTILFLLFTFIGISSFSQEGGMRSLKTISDKIIFKDLSGSGNKVIGIDNNGRSKKISVDGVTIILENDTLKASASDITSTLIFGWTVKWDGTKFTNHYNPATQTLSGTNVTWDLSSGKDATITLTGNTVITLTNATTGLSGTLWVTNPSTTYTITFAGYVNSIDPSIRLGANMVITSGGSKSDDYSYKYNGSKMNWNGTLDRK